MHCTRLFWLAAFLCLTGHAVGRDQNESRSRQEIERGISEQAKAWNRGDIDGFMAG